MTGYIPRWFTRPQTVTDPRTYPVVHCTAGVASRQGKDEEARAGNRGRGSREVGNKEEKGGRKEKTEGKAASPRQVFRGLIEASVGSETVSGIKLID